MSNRWVMIAVLALAAAGCSKTPPLSVECTFHDECVMTLLGDDCCDLCDPRPANNRSASALIAYCAKLNPADSYGKRCPAKKCEVKQGVTAYCLDGHCQPR